MKTNLIVVIGYVPVSLVLGGVGRVVLLIYNLLLNNHVTMDTGVVNGTVVVMVIVVARESFCGSGITGCVARAWSWRCIYNKSYRIINIHHRIHMLLNVGM